MLTHTKPQAAQTESRSLSGRAFDRMRDDILRCRLMPDTRLRMEDLRERYDTGFSPLREALMRLEAEGLVILEQNKGFRVAPVSRSHLLDLSNVRIEIECLALRWAIAKGDVSWEADLISAFHRLSRQSKTSPDHPDRISDAWDREHRRFHHALVAACGSEMLHSMRDALFDQAERYVALSIAYLDRPRDDVAEHEALMAATLARDVEKACALCRQHVERTAEKVMMSSRLEQAGQ